MIEDADLARLSPLTWRHINFFGRYNFAVPEVVPAGACVRFVLRVPNGTSKLRLGSRNLDLHIAAAHRCVDCW
ncbi:MAG: transposase [Pseudomonadota bacterium]|nr:transposase [Pseudomonadota bacterium]